MVDLSLLSLYNNNLPGRVFHVFLTGIPQDRLMRQEGFDQQTKAPDGDQELGLTPGRAVTGERRKFV